MTWIEGDPERRAENQGIAARLLSLETQLTVLVEIKKRDHADMMNMHLENKVILDKIKDAVYGNGKPGLNQRVHDLEGMFRVAQWVIGIGGSLVIMQLAQFFLTLFRNGHP